MDNMTTAMDEQAQAPKRRSEEQAPEKSGSEAGFVLTDDNYYSDQANALYLSNSLFKAAYGHPADPHPCEAAAIFGPRPESEALLVGAYVDAYFEGPDAFEKFKEENRDRVMQKSGKAPYKFILDADAAIARASRDKVFMRFMGGEHQKIMTGAIAGHVFKIKMDAYHPNEMIVDLKYVKTAGEEYCDALKKRAPFIETYGYFIQGAIYQEVVYQNIGFRLPFYIAYITKEAVPDFGVVSLPQDKLDDALEFVRLSLTAKPFKALKANPMACGRRSCPYCRDRKILAGPVDYADFEKYAST